MKKYKNFYEVMKKIVTKKKPIVFDIGANKGQSIDGFRKLYPECFIHAFEPDKSEFDKLIINYNKNTKETQVRGFLCKKCNIKKPLDEFYKKASRGNLCIACDKQKRHEYRKRPEVRERAYIYQMKRFYKKKYGISFEDYDEMLKKQKGLCAVCRKQNTKIDSRSKKTQRFHVDHCHETKKIRGLLCMKCNQGIGFFDDNILYLESCIRYLQNK